ncbi:MAG TPA: DUF2752 domain-containing protein [Candidatus Polarisedimenticolaceae bacterium]|nr:DUF2752 domain-containing protein [Candidatus Polarisedimenticolaceae bacterium]
MSHRRFVLGLVGSAAAAALALVAGYDPATNAWFPPCPFHAWTGLYCPGCGALRAAHALLRGDVRRALGFNALAVVAAPLLLAGVVREGYRLSRGADPIGMRLPAWSIRALLGVILAFGALRNLAACAWLAPR